MIQEREKAEFI